MAVAYATLAAEDFVVGEDQTVPFDKERAQRDIKGEGNAKAKGKKGKKQESENADG
jgi:hypothetical protein